MKALRVAFKEIPGLGLAVAGGNDLKETAKATLSYLDPELCDRLCNQVNGWGGAGATLFILTMFMAHRASAMKGEKEADRITEAILANIENIREENADWFDEHDRRRELGDLIYQKIEADLPDEMKNDTDVLIHQLFHEQTELRFDRVEALIKERMGEPGRRKMLAMAYANPEAASFSPQLKAALHEDLSEASREEGNSLFGMLEGLVANFLVPKVYLPLASTSKIGAAARFRFHERLVPNLVGRDDDLKALQAFLDHEEKVRWWLWTADGGQGKSRLALELLLCNYGPWRGGFVRGSFDASGAKLLFPDLSQWHPEGDIVFVVDYASGYAKQVCRAIQELTLNERHKQFKGKVRFLLLERYYATFADWAIDLRGRDQSIEPFMHEIPRRLSFLGLPDLMRVFDYATWNLTKEFPSADVRRKAEGLFAREDRVRWRRPLYAALLAYAFSEGQEPQDVSALDDYVLEHEERLWVDEYGATQCEVNAAFFSTLMGGLNRPRLREITRERFGIAMPNGETLKKVVSHSEADPNHDYSAIEPDLLGERFVARRQLGTFFLRDSDLAEVQDWSSELWREAMKGTDWSEEE